MTKLIKKAFGSYIETDDEAVISEAEKEGLEIIDILPNPNDYKPDNSDRPEIIRQKQVEESQKLEQEKIDIENKKTILADLEKLPYNFKSKTEREAMTFLQLSEYHSQVVQMPHLIEKIISTEQFQDDDHKAVRRKELEGLTYGQLTNHLDAEG
jgi:hypothetical protein